MTYLTKSALMNVITGLDSLSDQLTEQQMFDEAELLDDAVPFLNLLMSSDLLPEGGDEAADDTPASMESLREMCVKFKQLQLKLLANKAEKAELKMPFDDLRLKKIPDALAELGLKTATFAGLGRVQTASDLYASTRAGQKEAAMTWLRDCGYEDMIKETYNASTIKALFRKMIVEGVEIPDEIFSVTPFTRASIVKA